MKGAFTWPQIRVLKNEAEPLPYEGGLHSTSCSSSHVFNLEYEFFCRLNGSLQEESGVAEGLVVEVLVLKKQA